MENVNGKQKRVEVFLSKTFEESDEAISTLTNMHSGMRVISRHVVTIIEEEPNHQPNPYPPKLSEHIFNQRLMGLMAQIEKFKDVLEGLSKEAIYLTSQSEK